MTDRSDEHPKKDITPIVFNIENAVKVISERKMQSRKHSSPRDLTDSGTSYDVIGSPEYALFGMVVKSDNSQIDRSFSIPQFNSPPSSLTSYYRITGKP
jgi:hypothetical protein